LNSEKFWEFEPQHIKYDRAIKENKTKDQAKVIANIDPNAVKLINCIIAMTNAEIVVSSTWRSDWNIPYLLRYAGLIRPIYGITPLSKDRHRGREIKEWLDEHPEVTNYVIIDDDNDMLEEQEPHFVQTSWYEGINDYNVEKAIEILNN
jgi:hypothetical protein